MSDSCLEFEGLVKQARGKGMFIVSVPTNDGTTEIICTLSGKIRQNNIKVMEGDKVKVEVSVYDLTRGRITYRTRA